MKIKLLMASSILAMLSYTPLMVASELTSEIDLSEVDATAYVVDYSSEVDSEEDIVEQIQDDSTIAEQSVNEVAVVEEGLEESPSDEDTAVVESDEATLAAEDVASEDETMYSDVVTMSATYEKETNSKGVIIKETWFYNNGDTKRIKEYYSNGTIKSDKAFRENTGVMYSERLYDSKGIQTKYGLYHDNGQKRDIKAYKNGKLIARNQFDTNGKRESRTEYKKGVRSVHYTYYSNGKVNKRYAYLSDGEKYKGIVSYHDNGKKKQADYYDKGNRYRTVWYNSKGVKRAEATYYSNGSTRKAYNEYNTSSGKPVISKKYYYSSNSKTTRYVAYSGKYKSEERTYHSNGKAKQKNEYYSKSNRVEKKKWYNTSGKLTEQRIMYNNSKNTAKYKYKYDNGVLATRTDYDTGATITYHRTFYPGITTSSKSIAIYVKGKKIKTIHYNKKAERVKEVSHVKTGKDKGYTTRSVGTCNMSGSRKTKTVVDVGVDTSYANRDYYSYTNKYGQITKVEAAQIIYQNDDMESVVHAHDGSGTDELRYCKDEAEPKGVNQYYDAGHVIADSLGGAANAYNITPQIEKLNVSGTQAKIESQIRSYLGASLKVVTDYEMKMYYKNNSTYTPYKYTVKFKVNGVQKTYTYNNA